MRYPRFSGLLLATLLVSGSCGKRTHLTSSSTVVRDGKTERIRYELTVEGVEHELKLLALASEEAAADESDAFDLGLERHGITIRGRALDDVEGELWIGEHGFGPLEPPDLRILVNTKGVYVNGEHRGTLDP